MLGLSGLKNNRSLTRNNFEDIICRKRSKEAERFLKCQNNMNYFNKSNIRAEKEKQWSSGRSFDNRRNCLRKILDDDAETQKVMLENLTQQGKNKTELLLRSTALKQARDLEQSKLAEKLLAEHSRCNNPDLKKLKRDADERRTINTWKFQNNERSEIEHSERVNQLVDEEMQFEANLRESKKEEELEIVRLQTKQQHLKQLQNQLNELHSREAEADKLATTEKDLISKLVELDKLEKERFLIKEKSERELYGRSLLRQHHAALRRRSGLVQAELQADLDWLNRLSEQEVTEKQTIQDKKRQEMNNVMEMQNLIEVELEKERQQEIEFSELQAHEAARVWLKREQEWRNENNARQNLMHEVIEQRRAQVADQLAYNQELQRRELESREAMLEFLDANEKTDHFEAETNRKQQLEHRKELDCQISDKLNKIEQANTQTKREQVVLQQTEAAYVEMLRKETEKLRLEDNYLDNPQNYSKINNLPNTNRIGKKLW